MRSANHSLRSLALTMTFAFALRLALAQDVGDFEDNSFLIEEAYNQESGVVQHIATLKNERETVRGNRTSNTAFSFSQEWPIFGQRWQFAYGVKLFNVDFEDRDSTASFVATLGVQQLDLSLRYQAISGDDSPIAVAPELGFTKRNEHKGRKDSGVGFTIPASARLSKRLAAHANLSLASFPFSDRPQSVFLIGGSGIFAAHRRVHLLFEALAESERTKLGNGSFTETVTILSPGLRMELSSTSRGQWIAGFALPTTYREDENNAGFFLYFSFEHFYRK